MDDDRGVWAKELDWKGWNDALCNEACFVWDVFRIVAAIFIYFTLNLCMDL